MRSVRFALGVVCVLTSCTSTIETSASSRATSEPIAAGVPPVDSTSSPRTAAPTSAPADEPSTEVTVAAPPAETGPASVTDAAVVLFESGEAMFAVEPLTGVVRQLGKQFDPAGPRMFPVDEHDVIDGNLYWAVPAERGAGVDTSVVARVDLRTGEIVRHIELSDIGAGVPRSSYELLFVGQQGLLVWFLNSVGDPPNNYQLFDTATGSWKQSAEVPRLQSDDCADGFIDFQALADQRLIARRGGTLAFLDLPNGTAETIIDCGTTPVLADVAAGDAELLVGSIVGDSTVTSEQSIEFAEAVALTPGEAVVLGDDDLWWVSQDTVEASDGSTADVALVVRFDLATKTVQQAWPLGAYFAANPCGQGCGRVARPAVELAWIEDRLVMIHQAPGSRIHVLDPESGRITEIETGEQDGQVVRRLDLSRDQFGETHLLALRGLPGPIPETNLLYLSVIELDVTGATIVNEVDFGQVARLEALPIPEFPLGDPSRVWPDIRELLESERLLSIPSQAMAPTLGLGDAIIVASAAKPEGGGPERGDIVTFRLPHELRTTESELVKRIVATGGQLVEFSDNQLLVDGSVIDEPYLLEPSSTRPRLPIPGCDEATPIAIRCLVPADAFFMMGDNRLNSSDSRVYGPIAASSITGVVVEVVRAEAPG